MASRGSRAVADGGEVAALFLGPDLRARGHAIAEAPVLKLLLRLDVLLRLDALLLREDRVLLREEVLLRELREGERVAPVVLLPAPARLARLARLSGEAPGLGLPVD